MLKFTEEKTEGKVYTLDPERAVSWSMIASYKFNKEKWYFKYCVHGKCTREFCAIKGEVWEFCPVGEKSPEMEFGSMIGKKLETDPTYRPEVPRQKVMEYELKTVWKGIKLIGFADSLDDKIKAGEEYKTGRNEWTQKKVDEHGQITMYLFMVYLLGKGKPEEYSFRLHWLPTILTDEGTVEFREEGEIYTFHTSRSLAQCLEFGSYVEKTYKEMQSFALNHKPIVV